MSEESHVDATMLTSWMHDQCNPANVERLAKKRKIDEQPNDPESRAIANDDDSLSDSQQSSLSEKICLWQGDMTKLKIGAIVNAANEQLCPGGGICGAIYRAAGLKALDKEVRRRYPDGCVMGSTAVTPGFALPAKFIMHTVGPIGEQPDKLKQCYQSCLDECVEHSIRSICFCCISTGIYGYPNQAAAEVAISTVHQWLIDHPDKLDRIVFCTFLDVDLCIYQNVLPQHFRS